MWSLVMTLSNCCSRYTITNEELSIFINMQLATLASVIFGKPCLATYAFSILYIPGGYFSLHIRCLAFAIIPFNIWHRHIKPHTDRHQNEVTFSFTSPRFFRQCASTQVSLSLNLGLKTYVGEGEKRVPRKKRRRYILYARLHLAILKFEFRLRAPWPLYISPKGESEETAVPIVSVLNRWLGSCFGSYLPLLTHDLYSSFASIPPLLPAYPALSLFRYSQTMEVGEGVLYHGPEHVHFRRPLESGTSTQIIFGFRHVDRSHCNSQ